MAAAGTPGATCAHAGVNQWNPPSSMAAAGTPGATCAHAGVRCEFLHASKALLRLCLLAFKSFFKAMYVHFSRLLSYS